MPKLDKPKKVGKAKVDTFGKKSGSSTLFVGAIEPKKRKPKSQAKPVKGY